MTTLFKPLETALSTSGRPNFSGGEAELFQQADVAVYNCDERAEQTDTVFLSTHRLIRVRQGTSPSAVYVPLERVAGLPERSHGFLTWSSPKVTIRFQGTDQFIRLSFRGGGAKGFDQKLDFALSRKAWLSDPVDFETGESLRPTVDTRHHRDPHRGAGVGGIMAQLQNRDARDQRTLDTAFADINQLMKHAKDAAALAKRLSDRMRARQAGAAAEEGEDSEQAQEAALAEWVSSLGLSSVVTRQTVGSGHFHMALAEQLMDFLQDPLERQAGTMTVVDAFCLYNKARGVDLVSPDEMARACRCFSKIPTANIRLMDVGDGILILRRDDLAGDKRIQELLQTPADAITALALAHKLKVSSHVASGILADACRRGVLLRDDQSDQGTAYHLNYFGDY